MGFVEPAGLVLDFRTGTRTLYVADSGYGGTGRRPPTVHTVRITDQATTAFCAQSSPPMYRPLSVGFDWNNDNSFLYVADSAGLVFQYDLTTAPPTQRYTHQPVPAARHIHSMTVSSRGDVYLLDTYSRRAVIILAVDKTRWRPGQDCRPPALPTSSSSSSSSSAATHLALSSSSSTGSAQPQSAVAVWQGVVVVGVGVIALLVTTVVGAASCWHIKRTISGRGGRSRRRSEMDDKLLVEQREGEDDEEEEEEEEEEETTEWTPPDTARLHSDSIVDDVYDDNNKLAYVAGSSRAAVGSELDPTAGVDISTSSSARYDVYVARYEVVAAASDMHGVSRASLLLRCAPSPTSTSSTSDGSRGSTTPTDHRRPSSAVSPASTPRHIARLESAWQSVPHFISSISDLTIVGSGSGGLVYSGMYDGIACVVKLPKSVSLTGAAWREWQCHLRLPPHPNLVRFLGALPMSNTNYLVTAAVRQGSLHSILRSSAVCSSSYYSRPYGVMRCARDMCAVLHHIHSCGIVHREVSCHSILVDSDGRMVLADLGLAMQLDARTSGDDQQTAVPVRWTSPEALSSSTYSSRSDVWSLGVALWEMTAGGRLPYSEQQSASSKSCVRPIIQQQLTLQVDDTWAGDDTHMTTSERKLADIVRRTIQLCLTYDVQQRPDSGQLVGIVDEWWDEWRQQAGHELPDIERRWHDHHERVQHRLGLPVTEKG